MIREFKSLYAVCGADPSGNLMIKLRGRFPTLQCHISKNVQLNCRNHCKCYWWSLTSCQTDQCHRAVTEAPVMCIQCDVGGDCRLATATSPRLLTVHICKFE